MNKQIITILIGIIIIAIAIPVTLRLVSQQQQLKSKALGPGQAINIPSASCDSSGNCSVAGPSIDVQVTGPNPPANQ